MPSRQSVGSVLNKLIERVNSDMRRIRLLEQESAIYKERLNSAEAELLSQRSLASKSLEDSSARLSQMEDRILSLENSVREIILQLKKSPPSSKIRELEQLIDIFNPLKSNFVTREEVEKILEEKMRE